MSATRPSSTRRPAYMTSMRSAICATAPMSWVIRMMAVCSFDPRSLRRAKISACTVTSSAVVGSSAIINSGSLVSDDIVERLVETFIADKKYKDRLIFDGYPRNLIQTKTLQDLLLKHGQEISLVLKLSVSLETITKRILERRTIEKRKDDNKETAIKRYQTYEKSTEPVIEYYKKLNLLKVI